MQLTLASGSACLLLTKGDSSFTSATSNCTCECGVCRKQVESTQGTLVTTQAHHAPDTLPKTSRRPHCKSSFKLRCTVVRSAKGRHRDDGQQSREPSSLSCVPQPLAFRPTVACQHELPGPPEICEGQMSLCFAGMLRCRHSELCSLCALPCEPSSSTPNPTPHVSSLTAADTAATQAPLPSCTRRDPALRSGTMGCVLLSARLPDCTAQGHPHGIRVSEQR